MDATIVGAIIGAIAILCVNAILFSYYYGRVTQRVDDHERRLTKLEEWRNTF